MIRTFKEFTRDKQLNERLFSKVGKRDVPVYLNPTISDLENLVNAGAYRIRGLSKDQYIFVWAGEGGYHRDIFNDLVDIDPDLEGYPDICFYLDAQRNNSAGPNPAPLSFELVYSQFTGQSTKTGNSYAHLKRLMQFPVMQKLSSYINNGDEILHPEKYAPSWAIEAPNEYDDEHVDKHKLNLFDPTKYTHADAIWKQKTQQPQMPQKPQNPYKWRSGLHRVGD